jgi:hypothetical protein
MDIATDNGQVGIRLDGQAMKPRLEDVACMPLPPIKAPRIAAIEILHDQGKRMPQRLEKQMVMVSHQAVGVQDERIALVGDVQQGRKSNRSVSSWKIGRRLTPRLVRW